MPDAEKKPGIWYRQRLGARDEEAKERCMEACIVEKGKVKRCIYQSKKKVNEQFGRKVNEDVNGNRNCFGRR